MLRPPWAQRSVRVDVIVDCDADGAGGGKPAGGVIDRRPILFPLSVDFAVSIAADADGLAVGRPFEGVMSRRPMAFPLSIDFDASIVRSVEGPAVGSPFGGVMSRARKWLPRSCDFDVSIVRSPKGSGVGRLFGGVILRTPTVLPRSLAFDVCSSSTRWSEGAMWGRVDGGTTGRGPKAQEPESGLMPLALVMEAPHSTCRASVNEACDPNHLGELVLGRGGERRARARE